VQFVHALDRAIVSFSLSLSLSLSRALFLSLSPREIEGARGARGEREKEREREEGTRIDPGFVSLHRRAIAKYDSADKETEGDSEVEKEERERAMRRGGGSEREIAAAGPRPAFEIQMGFPKKFKSRARSQMHRPSRRVF